MTRKLVFIAIGAALIAGCGIREPLRPADGASLPAPPPLATRALTTDELLAVPTEFRPLRVDEPLTRSERRPVDRFDLPPPEVGGETEADASELEEEPEPAAGNPPQ